MLEKPKSNNEFSPKLVKVCQELLKIDQEIEDLTKLKVNRI